MYNMIKKIIGYSTSVVRGSENLYWGPKGLFVFGYIII